MTSQVKSTCDRLAWHHLRLVFGEPFDVLMSPVNCTTSATIRRSAREKRPPGQWWCKRFHGPTPQTGTLGSVFLAREHDARSPDSRPCSSSPSMVAEVDPEQSQEPEISRRRQAYDNPLLTPIFFGSEEDNNVIEASLETSEREVTLTQKAQHFKGCKKQGAQKISAALSHLSQGAPFISPKQSNCDRDCTKVPTPNRGSPRSLGRLPEMSTPISIPLQHGRVLKPPNEPNRFRGVITLITDGPEYVQRSLNDNQLSGRSGLPHKSFVESPSPTLVNVTSSCPFSSSTPPNAPRRALVSRRLRSPNQMNTSHYIPALPLPSSLQLREQEHPMHVAEKENQIVESANVFMEAVKMAPFPPCQVVRASKFTQQQYKIGQQGVRINLLVPLSFAYIGEMTLQGFATSGLRRGYKNEVTYIVSHAFIGIVFLNARDTTWTLKGGDYAVLAENVSYEFCNQSSLACTLVVIEPRL